MGPFSLLIWNQPLDLQGLQPLEPMGELPMVDEAPPRWMDESWSPPENEGTSPEKEAF